MSTFINLSPKQSKNIDNAIFKNARQLRKDALLIVEKNKSYSSANSLLILSSEEVIKAILVLLHSEGYEVYQISDAKKFFYNHEIRHQLAQLLEMTAGFIESVQKYENRAPVKLFKTNNVFGGFLNFVHEIATASDPFVDSTKRIKDLENFNDNKNNGLYVGYKDKLIIPKEKITEAEYRKTKEIVERIFRVYKKLRILYHPCIHNRKDQEEIEDTKMKMKIFIDEGMEGFSFKELSFK
ncbi:MULTISPECIES: AbiV family abortive infection protein [Flavobacterium]|uniref:AbiV family abortive infection protein n=1 Tax=Flavobacterium algoritolerans TaxID=3041254 RepID=A0ABT6VAS8_9FLAO|nr:AbiV family abortive infection protein [Flavobacterium algoritolerans]MDI5895347.1 AbiV family abortive infection protein [Flavobacterium algoritolerans]